LNKLSVQIENASFAWDKKRPFLQIDRLELKRGDKMLLMGASGIGKSSFLFLLAGLSTVQSGVLKVFGSELSRMAPSERDKWRAKQCAFIFQDFNLIPYLSAFENVLLGRKFGQKSADPKRATDLLDRFGISLQERLKFPHSLSVGQQQRVACARALYSESPLILADEPGSALDDDNHERLLELLSGSLQEDDKTLVCVSHRQLSMSFDCTVNASDWRVRE